MQLKSPVTSAVSLLALAVAWSLPAAAQTGTGPANSGPAVTPPPSTAVPAYPPAPAYGYAQPYAPYPAPGYAPEPAEEKRDPRVADANADRVVLLPTAYTHPEGTVYFSSNELVLLQAGYAVSDSTQITLTGTPPLDRERIWFFDLSLKNAFVHQGPFRMAAIGSVMGLFGIDQGNVVLGRVGAVAQFCFDEPCESSASLSSHVLLAGPATLMVTGVGGTWRIAKWAALLLEVDTFIPLGSEVGEYKAVAVVPGFRFPYRTWALDIAAARALDTQDPPDPAVIPWVAFTYRFLP